jgi:hypothetical protein
MSSPSPADLAADVVDVAGAVADDAPDLALPAPAARRLSLRTLPILWPAFVAAGVIEALVFALVDPAALHLPGARALPLSPSAVYTIAFFVFWAVVAASAAVTRWLDASVAAPRR